MSDRWSLILAFEYVYYYAGDCDSFGYQNGDGHGDGAGDYTGDGYGEGEPIRNGTGCGQVIQRGSP